MLFAQQFNNGCNNILSKHIIDFGGKIFTNGLIVFIEKFNWAFLLFLLFLCPSFYNKVKELTELISDGLEKFGKAKNVSFNIVGQNTEDKKVAKKEKEEEIRDLSQTKKTKDDSEREEEWKKRREIRGKMENYIKNEIKKQNIDDFEENIKLNIDNDPIANSIDLRFDASYRYKGKDRARRYISTLFTISGSIFIRIDKLYQYIRIMQDINKRKNNQMFAIEVIFLDLSNESKDNNKSRAYNECEKMFSKALEEGILAIKEYKYNGEEYICTSKNGWILG